MKAIAKKLPGIRTTPMGDMTLGYGDYIMYAVTHDIEVGDEVFNCQDMKGIVQEDGTIDLFDEYKKHLRGIDVDPKEHTTNFQWGKILGELSPNATWVEDGDEIEINDQWWGLTPTGRLEWWSLTPTDKLFKYRKVKCEACNTYH